MSECHGVTVSACQVCQCVTVSVLTLAVTSGEWAVTRSEEWSEEDDLGLPPLMCTGADRPRRTPFCENTHTQPGQHDGEEREVWW